MKKRFSEKEDKSTPIALAILGIVFVVGIFFYFFDKKKSKPVAEESPYNPKDCI